VLLDGVDVHGSSPKEEHKITVDLSGQTPYSDSAKNVHDLALGDNVIRSVAELCQSQISQRDVFGRIGGDEFGIINKSKVENSLAFGKRLNTLVESSFSDIPISISIGVGQFRDSDTSIQQIYQRADLALYQSKQAGKNRC
jgi:diguanylate cyclase (GGDEF)-like protein